MTLAPLPERTGPFRVLAISGSLRTQSANTLLLQGLAALAPPTVAVSFFTGLSGLPHFNPDLDDDARRPAPVEAWREAVAAADGLLISSPEYAHGVPGSLKNALDWLVSGPEFPAILVALPQASPHSTHVQAALAETLRTMSGEIVAEASVVLPLAGRRISLPAILADPALTESLRGALAALEEALARARGENRRLCAPTPRPRERP